MASSLHKEQVRINADNEELHATLWMPEPADGVIIFASENVNRRLDPHSDYLASIMREVRLATLSLEIMPSGSASPPGDEAALARRVRAAADWLAGYPPTAGLPLGLCGVGAGASPALLVAADLGRRVCALVVRGGQPDRSSLSALVKISAPTLLIVAGLDEGAAERNRAAYAALRCRKRFEIIPGASRSFDEPGNPEVVVRLMRSWFVQQVHYTCP
jgi:putative phosphoribosyl transferase